MLGDGNVVLPDYADPEPQVRLSVVIDAPPAAVWKALTEPALLNQWLARAAEVELHAGGKFDLGWAPSPQAMCRVLEVEPNRRLRISWPDWRGQAQVPDQHVTFELVPQGDGTRVDFVHGGFVRPADRSDYQQGWTGFLDGLRDLCQGAAR